MGTSVQSAVTLNPPAGQAGVEYDIGFNDVVSRKATVAIPFGSIVTIIDDVTCKLPTATGEVTASQVGIALRDDSKASGAGYAIDDEVRVMVKGRAFVAVEGTVAAGGAIFARFASGAGGTALGALRADADTASAVAIPSAKFVRGITGAGITVASINQP